MSLEYCIACGEPTGRAGRGDDSLYHDSGAGPYCLECFESVDALTAELAAVKAERDVALATKDKEIQNLEKKIAEARIKVLEESCEVLEESCEVQEFYMHLLRHPGGWSIQGMERAKIEEAWQRRSASNDELRATYKAALAAVEGKS